MNNKKIYIKSIILSLLILVSSLAITSVGYNKGLFLSYFTDIRVAIYNFIPIYLIMIFLAFVFRSLRTSFLITSLIVNIGSYVNYIKIIYREEPFLAKDLKLFNEAFAMSKKYSLNFTSANFIIFVIAIIITIIIFRKMKKDEIYYIHPLINVIVSAGLLLVFVFGLMFNYDSYHAIGAKSGLSMWSQVEGYQSKGFVYPFIYSIKYSREYKYSNYNEKIAKKIYDSYEYKNIPEDKKVNIIGIMMESFKDFSVYQSDSLVFQKDPYEYFHKLENESLHGNILVNTFGGGTFVTESNFLSGYKDCPSFDRPTITYPRYFKEQGYETYAFHPNVGSFYNRQNVYPNMGFDKFFEYNNTFKKMNENLLSDNDFFNFILDKYNASDKKDFYFAVTYQNHGPYSKDDITPDETYIKWNDKYSKEWYNYFNHYLNGISFTSQSLQILTDNLRYSEKPTILVLFGDHCPSMGDNKICFDMFNVNYDGQTTEGIKNLYSTPYIVWANESAKKMLGKDFVGQGKDLEPAFLMNEILNYAGIEGNQYNQFLTTFTQKFTAIKEHWFGVNGEYKQQLNDEEKKELDEYKDVEYYTSHLLENQ